MVSGSFTPGTGHDKASVVAYYARAAPRILPHVAGRPLTFRRYPRGVGAPGFFQKNVPPHYPALMQRIEVPRRDGVTLHAAASEAFHLEFLANQGVIELHVPTVRAATPSYPDRFVIDLDLAGRRGGARACVARLVHTALDGFGLRTVAVATGSKGYHVVAAILPTLGTEVLARAAQQLAALLVARAPDELTTTFRVASAAAASTSTGCATATLRRWSCPSRCGRAARRPSRCRSPGPSSTPSPRTPSTSTASRRGSRRRSAARARLLPRRCGALRRSRRRRLRGERPHPRTFRPLRLVKPRRRPVGGGRRRRPTAVHVALLRGINVGGKHKLPMNELVALFEAAGCASRCESLHPERQRRLRGVARLRGEGSRRGRSRHRGFLRLRGPDCHAHRLGARVRLRGEPVPLQGGANAASLHVAFLADRPTARAAAALDPARSPPDMFAVCGREIYLRGPNGLGRTKLTNDYFDRTLGTTSTVRNWNTVEKLVALAKGR